MPNCRVYGTGLLGYKGRQIQDPETLSPDVRLSNNKKISFIISRHGRYQSINC